MGHSKVNANFEKKNGFTQAFNLIRVKDIIYCGWIK